MAYKIMKKYFVFLIFFSLIFFIGCSGSRSILTEQGPLTGSPNGIQIKFLPDQPSNELFENSDVYIGLELTNNAACDAIGKLCISDSAPSYRGGITEPICDDFNLIGATIEGKKSRIEKDNFYLRTPSYTSIDRQEGLQFTIEATATYNCEVTAGPQLCVKSSLAEDSSCKSSEEITGNVLKASVAPVTITKVVKKFSPQSGNVRLVTEIYLSKMSKGYVSNSESIENPLVLSEENPIIVDVNFDGNQMECSGRDFRDNKLHWKFDDKEPKKLICSTLLNVVERVDGNLNINLNFVYKTTESKSIKITKLT